MQGNKILLVEDDQYIRSVYNDILTESGFDVTDAEDGQEGLVKAQKGGYNVILLDIMMPKMDGLSFLKELKRTSPEAPNGKIILLTNLAHSSIVEEGIELGAHSFLIKSDITPNDLVNKIKSLLS